MPKGLRGEKRPADAIGRAVHIAKIATGEIEDERDEKLSSAAAELGRVGGKARAQAMTPERRSEIARSPAMAAGITDRLWSLEDIVAKIDALAPTPKPRGPYRKRTA